MSTTIEVCGVVGENPMWPDALCVMEVGHEEWTTEDHGGTMHRAVRRDGMSYSFFTFPAGHHRPPISEIVGIYGKDHSEETA